AKQLRGKGRDVSRPVHAGDGEGLDKLICKWCVAWPDHLFDRVLDFANEGDATGAAGGKPPEFVQKLVVSLFNSGIREGPGDVVSLGFLHGEANLVNSLLHVEIEHLAGSLHIGR